MSAVHFETDFLSRLQVLPYYISQEKEFRTTSSHPFWQNKVAKMLNALSRDVSEHFYTLDRAARDRLEKASLEVDDGTGRLEHLFKHVHLYSFPEVQAVLIGSGEVLGLSSEKLSADAKARMETWTKEGVRCAGCKMGFQVVAEEWGLKPEKILLLTADREEYTKAKEAGFHVLLVARAELPSVDEPFEVIRSLNQVGIKSKADFFRWLT
jgi:hypothetical protein